MVSVEEWNQARRGLRLGQKLSGTVAAVPNPGATGIFVDIGLPVGGFVDVLLRTGDGPVPAVFSTASARLRSRD